MSSNLKTIQSIINDAQMLSNEDLELLKKRLFKVNNKVVIPLPVQMQFDIFPNKLLLEKFIKYISYQDRLDLDKQSGYPADYSLEDRFKARTLKEEIIDHLKSISS